MSILYAHAGGERKSCSPFQDADRQDEALPEASALLAGLRQIDFKHVQASVRDLW